MRSACLLQRKRPLDVRAELAFGAQCRQRHGVISVDVTGFMALAFAPGGKMLAVSTARGDITQRSPPVARHDLVR